MPDKRSKIHDVGALTALIEMANRVGYVYGSEDISMLFYSLIRRERPKNIVEFGSGLGVTALWMAQAVKENGSGRVWTIDDGSDWQDLTKFRKAISPLVEISPFDCLDPAGLDYASYMDNIIEVLGLGGQLTFLNEQVDMKKEDFVEEKKYPFMDEPIDFVFLDINRTPNEIINSLYFLLPYTAEAASVFMDSASTSLASYLFLERLVDQLNRSKIPRRFLKGKSDERRRLLIDIVSQRQFTLIHLIDRVKREQNSTAWLKIEPNDFVPHPQAMMKWV